jgi:CHAT domain-containing protein
LDGVTLSNLAGSGEEVISASKILKGNSQLLLQTNATEAQFKALQLADFRVVHLAVHGVANTQFPDRAALVLGRSPTSGEDGLLQVREIRYLSLRLMKRLYQHLIDGYDKDTALRQAKLDLLNQFGDQALPVYWAGFTLVGDGSNAVFR